MGRGTPKEIRVGYWEAGFSLSERDLTYGRGGKQNEPFVVGLGLKTWWQLLGVSQCRSVQNESGYCVHSILHSSPSSARRGLRAAMAQTQVSTSSIRILPPEYLSLPRATRPLGEMADSWLGARKVLDKTQQLKGTTGPAVDPSTIKGITGQI